MTNKKQCFRKEFNSGVVGITEILKELPRLVLLGIVGIFPLVLTVAIVIIKPEGFAPVYIIGSIISIMWMITIGLPLATTYFYPNELVKNMDAKSKRQHFGNEVKKSIKEVISFICFSLKHLPRAVFALGIMFLPVWIWGYIMVTQHPTTGITTTELILLGVSMAVTLIWATLIGFPLINCYIYPGAFSNKTETPESEATT